MFSTGLITIVVGFLIFLVIWPPFTAGKIYFGIISHLFIFFVFMSSLRSLCSQFVRAKQFVKLYALDGVLSTIMVIVFNILFLVVFRMGIVGYVLAISVSDFLSSIFLFVVAGAMEIYRFKRYK